MDPQGRYIILKAEITDKMYVLINIYASNKGTCIIKLLNMLLIALRKENLDEEENIILGGDFNCPLNPLLDKKKSFTRGQNSPMIFWTTYWLIISNSLYDSVTGTDIIPAIKTDHSF